MVKDVHLAVYIEESMQKQCSGMEKCFLCEWLLRRCIPFGRPLPQGSTYDALKCCQCRQIPSFRAEQMSMGEKYQTRWPLHQLAPSTGIQISQCQWGSSLCAARLNICSRWRDNDISQSHSCAQVMGQMDAIHSAKTF